MWKNLSIFLLGLLTSLVVVLKLKKPETINVSGDLIESQKIKDNTKIKLSWRARHKIRKANRILRRKNKKLSL